MFVVIELILQPLLLSYLPMIEEAEKTNTPTNQSLSSYSSQHSCYNFAFHTLIRVEGPIVIGDLRIGRSSFVSLHLHSSSIIPYYYQPKAATTYSYRHRPSFLLPLPAISCYLRSSEVNFAAAPHPPPNGTFHETPTPNQNRYLPH